jgi:hypothetical protein
MEADRSGFEDMNKRIDIALSYHRCCEREVKTCGVEGDCWAWGRHPRVVMGGVQEPLAHRKNRPAGLTNPTNRLDTGEAAKNWLNASYP